MTRVLALVTDAYGGHGGIAQAARDVIDALAAQETIATIDVLPRHASDAVAELPSKVRQRRASPGKVGYIARSIAATLLSRPHLIFCNHLFMAPLAALVAKLSGAKLIVQLHGIEIWSPPTQKRRWALQTADLLLCVSRDTRAHVLTHADIPPERAIVVNNTVGGQFHPGDHAAARAKFGLGDEFALLSVGRLDSRERYKGQDRIIEELPGLSAPGGRRLTYLIAGGGDDRPRLENLARASGVGSQIRFLGQVPAADLQDLYRASDLFVLPSTGEGFGIAFVEAMACGTPALGLAVGGAPDALGDDGLGILVGPGADLATALQSAIRKSRPDPERLATAVHARFGLDAFQRRIAQARVLVH